MKIVFLADIVGNPGRRALKKLLPGILASEQPDLVIANGENSAGGTGMDPGTAAEISAAGVEVITSGNHIWGRKEIYPYLESHRGNALRPANYPDGAPGAGSCVYKTRAGVSVGIANLIGRIFMGENVDSPFLCVDRIISNWEGLDEVPKIRFIDFHAEATSEKGAMAYHLNGRVSAVVGTHTHVQTADEYVLSKGTAFISDAGMCGVVESILGFGPEKALQRFLTGLPIRLDVEMGTAMVNGVVIDVDENDGRARTIKRIRILESD